MGNLKIELDVFSNSGATYDEDGNAYPSQSLEAAIISAAAEKLLSVDVPNEDEKKPSWSRTDKVRALLEKEIRTAVEERIKAVTMEELEGQVREVIAGGWPITDRHGAPTGEKLTLKLYVVQLLNGKADSYERETRIEKYLRTAIEVALKETFEAELKKVGARFREQIDGVLQAKLREQLAGALGLKA